MKTIKITLMLMLCLIGLASCSDSSDDSEQMTNYVTLAASGESSMYEDDTTGINIQVTMAYSIDKDATITLALSGDNGAVSLSPATVTIPAGEKTATVKLISNQQGILLSAENVNVTVASCSETNMKPIDASGITLTVRPAAAMPTLTEAQLALIQGYKDNLGIDLTRVLGVVDVNTTITFGNDDKDTQNGGEDTRVLSGKSVITLSDYATADTPVLKMITNPMGMESFMYEQIRSWVSENPDGYSLSNPEANPYASAIFNVINYNLATETFSVVLDSITLNADGTLNFTKVVSDDYGDVTTTIPFSYDYSVWNRVNSMRDQTVEVNEGETTASYTIGEILDTYGNYFYPASYLGNSDVATDVYGYEPSNFIEPSANADFDKGQMTFNFSWDYGQGGILYDYIRVNVVYTMHK